MRKLGRTSEHRMSLMKNLSVALIMHGSINTTISKAKDLRMYIEPIITAAKDKSLHSQRRIRSKLHNVKGVITKLHEIADIMMTRHGGYTSIKRVGHRVNDNSVIANISIIGYYPSKKNESDVSVSQNEIEE